MYSPSLLTCGKGEAFVSDPSWRLLCFPMFFNLTLMNTEMAQTATWHRSRSKVSQSSDMLIWEIDPVNSHLIQFLAWGKQQFEMKKQTVWIVKSCECFNFLEILADFFIGTTILCGFPTTQRNQPNLLGPSPVAKKTVETSGCRRPTRRFERRSNGWRRPWVIPLGFCRQRFGGETWYQYHGTGTVFFFWCVDFNILKAHSQSLAFFFWSNFLWGLKFKGGCFNVVILLRAFWVTSLLLMVQVLAGAWI